MRARLASPIPVLTYHSIRPEAGPYSITPEAFEGQLSFLRSKGYRTLNGSDLKRVLHGEIPAVRSVVLTFDDGYADNWYFAAPLLRKYGMRALLFAITEKVEDSDRPSRLRWDERKESHPYLTWGEIAQMVATDAFEIHSHTHTHSRHWVGEKSMEATRQAVAEDVTLSIRALRNRGYFHDIQLAWPWGYFRNDWVEDAEANGVSVCHTMLPGTNFPGQNMLKVRRLGGGILSSNSIPLFSVSGSSLGGVGLNIASDVWRLLRARQ